MNKRYGWWNTLSVGQKMSFIPGVFILAIAILVVVTTNALEEQRSAASRVNLASYLRGLTQAHLKEVLLARAGAEADYETTREKMKSSLNLLRHGGSVEVGEEVRETLPAATDSKLLTQLQAQERQLPELFALADRLLPLPREHHAEAQLLSELQRTSEEISEVNQAIVVNVVRVATDALTRIVQLEWTLAMVSVLFGSFMAWSVTRSILVPLTECVAAAQDVGAGNLAGQPLEVNSRDEVGRLAETFNQMRSNLRELLGGVSTAVETLGASCSQILAASKQQAAGASEQAVSIQETTSTMEEVGQTGNQITERARQVAAEAEATSAASIVGIEGIKQATEAMENIRRQVEAVAENVVSLSERTQAVGEVIAAVKDISERSNLLALNAAIEAAAAGEDGRSFGVVAGEMKSLAEQSREATLTVRRILEEIQKGINTSVMLTEEAVKRVEAGRKHTAKAETTIRDLNEKVGDSVQAFQQITAATNQQQIGYEQVAQALRNIETATEQTAAATRQLEASVVDLNELSGRLQTSTRVCSL